MSKTNPQQTDQAETKSLDSDGSFYRFIIFHGYKNNQAHQEPKILSDFDKIHIHF